MSGKAIHHIAEIHKIAKEKDGICLSKRYKNCDIKLKWKCNKDNFIWYASLGSIIYANSWCPKCARERIRASNSKYNIEDIRKYAIEHNGIFLSNKYKNINSKLKFRCNKDNHIWITSRENLRKGTWCPKCAGHLTLKLDDIKKLAKERDGICLSKRYKNNKIKLKFKCNKDGYEWFTTAQKIRKGRWCPICSSGKSERLCRNYIERKTKYKFMKCKPKWLQGLELDGYNEKLKLAFEYNGTQHYVENNHFHRFDNDFNNQQKRDRLKRRLCKINRVKLITIPYKYNCYNPEKMYKFIDSKFKL